MILRMILKMICCFLVASFIAIILRVNGINLLFCISIGLFIEYVLFFISISIRNIWGDD